VAARYWARRDSRARLDLRAHARTYFSLKIVALVIWGALSFGIPAFVFCVVYMPAGQYLLGAVAVAAGAACMVWPFLKFGWPELRRALAGRD
jgi:hypothetical protein